MGVGRELSQASKTTLVFVVTASVFDLLGKLSIIVPYVENKVNIKDSIEHFYKVNMLWIIAALLIIVGLSLYIRKADGNFNLNFLTNPTIRLTSGFLIIFEGIINLLKKASVLILNIQAIHQGASLMDDKTEKLLTSSLTSDVITIMIVILQILLGFFFIFYKKKNKEILSI